MRRENQSLSLAHGKFPYWLFGFCIAWQLLSSISTMPLTSNPTATYWKGREVPSPQKSPQLQSFCLVTAQQQDPCPPADKHGIRLDCNLICDPGWRVSAVASKYQNIIINECLLLFLWKFSLLFILLHADKTKYEMPH